MGLPLLIIGLLMVITGSRGTYAQFGSQISTDFQSTGTFGQSGYSPGFGIWILAIGSIGALGYIPEIRTISRYLMALVILVLFLHNKGFFAQFQSALAKGPLTPNALPATSSGSSAVAGSNPINYNPGTGTYSGTVPVSGSSTAYRGVPMSFFTTIGNFLGIGGSQ